MIDLHDEMAKEMLELLRSNVEIKLKSHTDMIGLMRNERKLDKRIKARC